MKTSRAVWKKQVRRPGSLFSDLSKDPQSGSEGSAPRGCRTWMEKSFGCKCSQEYWPLLITYLLPARFSSVQFNPVAQSCLTLCDPMDCSMPGFPVHHQLPELTQTHVHCVGDAIQPSHPLLSPSPPTTFNLSQHQGLFQWVGFPHQMAKVLEFQLQHLSFQWIFRTDFL